MRNPYGAYLVSNPALAKSVSVLAQRQQEQSERKYAEQVVEEIALPESRRFVASYPAYSFGRLSVDPEMLARVHAKFYYRFDNKVPEDDRLAEALDSVWSHHAQDYLKHSIAAQFDYHDRALAVLRVFWANTPDDPMHETAVADRDGLHGSNQAKKDLWFERYSFLYSCPEAIPYFEVGLLDIDMVKNAIANGVDPSILASAVQL